MNNILNNDKVDNGDEVIKSKRLRKGKKFFDPDTENVEGEFVGNELYSSRKKKAVTEESGSARIQIPEIFETSTDKIYKAKPASNPTKKTAEFEGAHSSSKSEADNKPIKRKIGRPRKDSKPVIIDEQLDADDNDNDNDDIVDDGKRKRKKKEFFDEEFGNREENVSKRTRENDKTANRSSLKDYDMNKSPKDKKRMAEKNAKNKGSPVEKQKKKKSMDVMNLNFTTRSLDLLLASYDFKPSLLIKKSFHGRYLDESVKRAILHLLYNWSKPPQVASFDDKVIFLSKKTEFKKMEISIAEIQEILFFCPIDTKELYSMRHCKRLLGVQMNADMTVGQEITDLIRNFLSERSCYDAGLQTFSYPHDSDYLVSSILPVSSTSIHQLKKLNLKLPLSSACFKVIMEHVLNSRKGKDITVNTKAKQIMESTSIGKSSVYLELNSGNGMQVLQIAAMVGCRCYGVELNEPAYESSCQLLKEFDMVLEELNIFDRLSSRVEFMNSDILEQKLLLSESTTIYFNNADCSDDICIQFCSQLMSVATKSIKKVITPRNLITKLSNVESESIRPSRTEAGVFGVYYIQKQLSYKSVVDTKEANMPPVLINNSSLVEESVAVLHESIDDSNRASVKGSRTYVNGVIYTGQFKNNMREGFGSILYPQQHPSQRLKYEGEWLTDKIHGNGIMTWVGGETYEGQWNNGIKHGFGKYSWTGGKTYVGEWRYGNMSGKGILQYGKHSEIPGRKSYEGEFRNVIPHGQGIILFEDGRKYEGGIVGNTMKGTGTLVYPPGDKKSAYIGMFLNDKFEGHGILKYADGKKYEGHWLGGQKSTGTLYYSKNDSKKRVKFVGTFQKGKIWSGIMSYTDKCSYDGKWQNDLPHGNGLARFVVRSYEGMWSDGLPHGVGRLYDNITKATLKEGEWNKGVFLADGTQHEELKFFLSTQ